MRDSRRSLVVLAVLVAIAVLVPAPGARASGHEESGVAEIMESLRDNPNELRMFFSAMPKGADLHHHITGAVFAETLIGLASDPARTLCLAPQTTLLTNPPCTPGLTESVADAQSDSTLYDRIVNNWSLRGFDAARGSAHDHFFAIFPQISLAVADIGSILAAVRNRAADENVAYLETMLEVTEASSTVRKLSAKLAWSEDYDAMRREFLEDPAFGSALDTANHQLDLWMADSDSHLGCGSNRPQAGCDVEVRFQYYALRVLPKQMVFGDIVFAFEIAALNDRVRAINMVGPEDNHNSMTDYETHMEVVRSVSRHHPEVLVDLHAGELVTGLVPPEGLRFHIAAAIGVAGARRIGHGVDVSHERRALDLLDRMAADSIAVEVPLTSNEALLGVSGNEHPLPVYVARGVPVVLATDDAGILRTDLTEQFVLAAQRYPSVGYADLKRIVRNSLEFSFLEGGSLWAAPARYDDPVGECAETLASGSVSSACRVLLDDNAKARLQMQLEEDLAGFEAEILRRYDN